MIQQNSRSLQSLHLEQITLLDERLPRIGCVHIKLGESVSAGCSHCKAYVVAGWLRIAAAYSSSGKTFELDFENISTHFFDGIGKAKHCELESSDVQAVYKRASQSQMSSRPSRLMAE